MKRTSIICLLLTVLPVCAMGQEPHPYSPIQLVNNSGYADDAVHFIALASIVDGEHKDEECVLVFDLADEGRGNCIPVTQVENLTQLATPFAAVKEKNLQVPILKSARLYVSLGYPLVLYTTINPETGKTTVVTPNGFNPREANYYNVHDKVEFSYADNGFFINPTAVDFYALPLRITNSKASYPLQASGLIGPHKTIVDKIKDTLDIDTTGAHAWQKLFVYFGDDQNTLLRFMSPSKAMVVNNSAAFDINYLNSVENYGFDYITTVWDYYQDKTLDIDAQELMPAPIDGQGAPDPLDYILTGQVEGQNFVFKPRAGSPLETVYLAKPSNSIPFFAGDTGTFAHANNTAKAVVVKNITATFTVGLLPFESGTFLDLDYFTDPAVRSKYYTDNPILKAGNTGPWFDLYGRALHSFEDQPIYTFAYDDHLKQDGTIHVNQGVLEPTVITLGDMQGMKIPDPYTEVAYEFNLIVGSGSGVEVYYNDKKITVADAGKVYQDTTPIHVVINGDPVDIYIEYPTVVMPDTPYSETAQDIVITQTAPGKANIQFPSDWK